MQLGDHYFKLKEFIRYILNTYLAAHMCDFAIPDNFKNTFIQFLSIQKSRRGIHFHNKIHKRDSS